MTFSDVEQAREAYRQKLQVFRRRAAVIVVIAVLIGALIRFPIGRGVDLPSAPSILFNIFPIFFFGLFGLIIGTIITGVATKKEALAFREAYKAYFVTQSLAKTFTNLKHSHQQGLDKNLLRATGMINTGDVYNSNDLVMASYKDVKFAQADVHIKEEREDSDGDTYYTTIFKGRFMIFEFPKKFNFKLELIGKGFHAYMIPRGNSQTGRKMQKIETESIDFNRHFRICAEDGFEAFYLLDPAMIEKIENISSRHGYNILFGFVDNTLLVALNDGKDSFEPPRPNRPIDEEKEQQKISADIKTITDFVDQLSLDRKIFTR